MKTARIMWCFILGKLVAKLELRGVEKFLARLDGFAPRVRQAASDAVYKQMEIVATDAKNRVPVDLGTLKSTIHARRDEEAGDAISSIAVAGPMPSDPLDSGPANDYAIVQHERLDFQHKVGEAKYLEKALDGQASKMTRQIAEDIKAAVGM